MPIRPDEEQSDGLRRRSVTENHSATPLVASIEAETTGPQEASPGRFPVPPSQAVIEDIRRRINETARPESIPELTWTSKPPEQGEHRLYHPEIDVERRRRPDGDMVPCPLCSPNDPKCLSFYLLWSSDGHLRPIGHICGKTHFGEHIFGKLTSDAKQAALRETNTEFLLSRISEVPSWMGEAISLREVCDRFEKLRRMFFKKVPTLHTELRRLNKEHDGGLVVVERADSDIPTGFRSAGGETSKMQVVRVSSIVGAEFLMPTFDPVSKAETIISRLAIATWGSDELLSDDSLLEVWGSLDDHQLANVVTAIVDAHRRARLLLEWLRTARSFLSEISIRELDRWARDERNEFRLDIVRVANGVVFRCKGIERVQMPFVESVVIPELQYLGEI